MKVVNDISLVARVVAFDDKRAFGSLVGKYQSQVRRFFLGLTLGDEALSDDLAQETFIKAYTNIGGFRGMSGFSTWLFRIGYHVFLDYARSRRTVSGIEVDRIDCAGGDTDVGLKLDIYNSLKLLKDEERLCVVLQLVEGQTIERVAEITGMPAGTVKSHLSRGKAKLAAILKENGYDGR